jgi:hypothetical protein
VGFSLQRVNGLRIDGRCSEYYSEHRPSIRRRLTRWNENPTDHLLNPERNYIPTHPHPPRSTSNLWLLPPAGSSPPGQPVSSTPAFHPLPTYPAPPRPHILPGRPTHPAPPAREFPPPPVPRRGAPTMSSLPALALRRRSAASLHGGSPRAAPSSTVCLVGLVRGWAPAAPRSSETARPPGPFSSLLLCASARPVGIRLHLCPRRTPIYPPPKVVLLCPDSRGLSQVL